MDLGLNDRNAIVLGSTRGMGFAIARRLAAEGAAVAVCGRSQDAADAAAAKIGDATGGRARGYAVDLSDAAAVDGLVASASADYPQIDILVCNGGGPPPGDVTGVADDLWLAQFRTMFVNQVRLANALLPGMRSRGWGRIVIVSSSGVLQPIPNLGISNTVRSAQIGWAKTLAAEVAKDGVTVNTVVPGRIQTERVEEIDRALADKLGKTVEDVVSASQASIPAGRYGRVEEFADTAAFLCSANASYVTGGIVRVDGGFIRGV